jgi:putative transposase
MGLVQALALFLRAFVVSRAALAAENLALRHPLSVLEQSVKRPKLCPRDRRFWGWLSRLWPNWRSVLRIVQPDTVLKWHKMGFQRYSPSSQAGHDGDYACRPRLSKLRSVFMRAASASDRWALGCPENPSPLT